MSESSDANNAGKTSSTANNDEQTQHTGTTVAESTRTNDERPADDAGTPSEHSSVVAREPDSTDNGQCADCRELRREVAFVKNQVAILTARCCLLESQGSRSHKSKRHQHSSVEAMVRACSGVTDSDNTATTPGNDSSGANNEMWRMLQRQQQPLKAAGGDVKESPRQQPQDTPSSGSATQTTPSATATGGTGSRKRLSNSPAPLSNVSLSNETDNSNDDDDMYRSDSGGGSGESAEMMRVAQQLLRPRDGDQADSASTNEAAPVTAGAPNGNEPPATAPPLTIATPLSTASLHAQQATLAGSTQQLLHMHAAHHPLISPPHHQMHNPHQSLLDSSTLAQLTPEAIKRIKTDSGTAAPGPIQPRTSYSHLLSPLQHGAMLQRPTTSPPQSAQQQQLQATIAALRHHEQLQDDYRALGIHLPISSASSAPSHEVKATPSLHHLGGTSSTSSHAAHAAANALLQLNQHQPQPAASSSSVPWQQILMWHQSGGTNPLANLEPGTLATLAAALQSTPTSQTSSHVPQHPHQTAFQSHDRPPVPNLNNAQHAQLLAALHQYRHQQPEPHQTHFGLQQQLLQPSARQQLPSNSNVPLSAATSSGSENNCTTGSGTLSVDLQVQLMLQQALQQQQTRRAQVQQSQPPRLPRPAPHRPTAPRFTRAVPDDFVREFVDATRNQESRQAYTIPVPEATEADPSFRAVSEEQILHSVKWHDLELPEAVTRLAKKLAEKRVFGPVLMSRATVAGTNHSNYSNLPLEGIRYIEEVCRRTLCPPGVTRQRFIDTYFRPAMKGLAARCRRIRHSLKPTDNRTCNNGNNSAGSSGSSSGGGIGQLLPASQDLKPSASTLPLPAQSGLLLPTTSTTSAQQLLAGGASNATSAAILAAAARARYLHQIERANGADSSSTEHRETASSATATVQNMIASLQAAAAAQAAANSATAVTPPAKSDTTET